MPWIVNGYFVSSRFLGQWIFDDHSWNDLSCFFGPIIITYVFLGAFSLYYCLTCAKWFYYLYDITNDFSPLIWTWSDWISLIQSWWFDVDITRIRWKWERDYVMIINQVNGELSKGYGRTLNEGKMKGKWSMIHLAYTEVQGD